MELCKLPVVPAYPLIEVGVEVLQVLAAALIDAFHILLALALVRTYLQGFLYFSRHPSNTYTLGHEYLVHFFLLGRDKLSVFRGTVIGLLVCHARLLIALHDILIHLSLYNNEMSLRCKYGKWIVGGTMEIKLVLSKRCHKVAELSEVGGAGVKYDGLLACDLCFLCH